ncbi:hypothetical protein H2201_000302 [Coniosporium apollinis]|uniref:FAD dependent oxidoreductase domain-containing protein n=1 Tax=Coniosporium apollinis TaxID=61459 RepID=A0ABQ9P4C0_9PEZI|nr:hypothetical protein H2201_000302 [Coniosporium apollinis]
MEARAQILPSLPVPNSTSSCWQDPPSAIHDLRSTEELPSSADYVIVGGGISGAMIAWNLLEKSKDARVVMLEARGAVSGATGRNDIVYDAQTFDAGVKAINMMKGNLTSEECLDGCGQYRIYGPEEAAERFHVDIEGYNGEKVAGAFEYEAGSISAYKFTSNILQCCLDRGLNLQTHTPVLGIIPCAAPDQQDHTSSPPPRWLIQTARGTIATPNVILATNGYTAHLLPTLQSLIVPLRGQITAQRPGTRLPQGGCLSTTFSFIYKTGYEYMITRPQTTPFPGDIIIGGGLGRLPPDAEVGEYGTCDDSSLNPQLSRYLRDCTKAYFGSHWGKDDPAGRVRKEWTGIMGVTGDGLPFVGQVPDADGLWVSAGFNGHGMVLALKCAEALVGMMLGEEISDWFPDCFRISQERVERLREIGFKGRKGMSVSEGPEGSR